MGDLFCGTAISQTDLDKDYWENQWQNERTGWDLGQSSPAIEAYIEQHQNVHAKILIPGCGNAHEAEFLWDLGYRDITLLDISPKATKIISQKFENKPGIKVVCEDFFEHHGHYDLVIEQTFFCALPTLMRKKYARKMHEVLNENGRIIGVLFNRNFEKNGPPFGGSIPEYEFIFKKYFQIIKMEECFNSTKPRHGTEAFINLKKIKL